MANKKKNKKKNNRQSVNTSSVNSISNSATPSEVNTPVVSNSENLESALDTKEVIESVSEETPTEPQKTPVEVKKHVSAIDDIVNSLPAGGPVGVGALGASKAATAAVLNRVEPIELPDYVQTGIDTVVASQAVDIDSIINTISQNVTNGEYKEKPVVIENSKQVDNIKSSPIKDEETTIVENTPSNINDSTVTTAAIVTSNKIASGDITNPSISTALNIEEPIEKATDTENIVKDVVDDPTKDIVSKKDDEVADLNENVKNGISSVIDAPAVDVNKISQSTNDSQTKSVETSQSSEQQKPSVVEQVNSQVVNQPENNNETVTVDNDKVISASKDDGEAKLSESVQHGINSVVDAPVIDTYQISHSTEPISQTKSDEDSKQKQKAPEEKKQDLVQEQKEPVENKKEEAQTKKETIQEPKKSQDIKRPEAAVGNANKPAMPSSTNATEATDNTRSKARLSENRKSGKKKKNCYIL